MWAWYTGLAGWQWILVTVGAITGIVASLLGSVAAIGKFIFSMGNPKHNNRCDCTACQRRRARQWDRTYGIDKPPRYPRHYSMPEDEAQPRLRGRLHGDDTVSFKDKLISTRELQTNMVVASTQSGTMYTVSTIILADEGYHIFLTNMENGKPSMVMIRFGILDLKIWRKVN